MPDNDLPVKHCGAETCTGPHEWGSDRDYLCPGSEA
jgi:hypothetical protein